MQTYKTHRYTIKFHGRPNPNHDPLRKRPILHEGSKFGFLNYMKFDPCCKPVIQQPYMHTDMTCMCVSFENLETEFSLSLETEMEKKVLTNQEARALSCLEWMKLWMFCATIGRR